MGTPVLIPLVDLCLIRSVFLFTCSLSVLYLAMAFLSICYFVPQFQTGVGGKTDLTPKK